MSTSNETSENVLRLKRYKEIMAAIRRNGLGFLFVRAAIGGPEKALRRAEKEFSGKSIGARLCSVCEELGPTFVKIGQILSTRTDIIPESIANDLAHLQDNVKQFSFEEAKEVIESQLQDDLHAVFPRFNEKPIASASMSQVYSAYMNTGRHVAVKVQRPHIREQIEVDMSILMQLAEFLNKHTRYGRLYDFVGMVSELQKSLYAEMDFTNEGENLEEFRKVIRNHDNITCPEVVWIYSTSKVLTMDFVTGTKINDIEALNRMHVNTHKIAKDFVQSLLDQILVYGFFHADPHPGNVMMVENGQKIEFIDLGMVGRLLPRFRNALNDLLLGIALQNMRKVATSIMEMDQAGARVNLYRLTKDCGTLLDTYLYVPLDQVNVADVFAKIFDLAGKYGMKIPRDLTMVGKCLGTAQGVIEELDPSLSVLQVAEDTVRMVLMERFGSRDFRKAVLGDAIDAFESVHQVPRFMLSLMQKMEDNDFGLQLRFEHLSDLERSLERMANRVSFCIILLAVGIVMAGIIIGVNMYTGPAETARYDVSMVSLIVGLVIAVLIVGGLIVNIIVTGRRNRQ